jgi:F-box protein 25/32
MFFYQKDWRSSGEKWIKTENGWERLKVIECFLFNLNKGYLILFKFLL